jgi:hypothetical protein
LESAVRGVTSEKTPQEIMRDIQTGALFGAGGGIAGGLIGKAAPRLASEAKKGTELAYLGTTDLKGRQALQYLKDMAGPGAKGMGKLKAVDKAREELVRVGKEIGAHVPGKMDEAILEHARTWDKIDDAVEALAPNVRASDLYSKAIDELDLSALRKEFGEQEVNAFLKQVLEMGAGRSGVANSRAFLRDIIDASYSQGTLKSGRDAALQRMQRQVAQGLRSGVDDIVSTIAEKSGVDVDFSKLKKDYLPMRAFAESGARADITPARFSMGSQTAEKLAAQELAKGLGMAGLGGVAGAATGEDAGDKIKGAAIGAIGGALGSRALGSLATRGISGAMPAVSGIEKLVQKAAPEALESAGAMVGGQAAAQVARKAIAEALPETPDELEAAQTGADIGQTGTETPAYVNKIMEAMKGYALAQGVPEDSPEFSAFAQQVYHATDGFAPDKVAGILYRDPGEKKAYLKALEVSRQLTDVLPMATQKAPGFLGGESDEEKIQRESAVAKLTGIVGEVTKDAGAQALAKKGLDSILRGREDPERKAELVKILLLQYGIDLDEIASLGVV